MLSLAQITYSPQGQHVVPSYGGRRSKQAQVGNDITSPVVGRQIRLKCTANTIYVIDHVKAHHEQHVLDSGEYYSLVNYRYFSLFLISLVARLTES